MKSTRPSEKEIQDVFDKLQNNVNSSKKVGIWQVHPIEQGTKLFTETH